MNPSDIGTMLLVYIGIASFVIVIGQTLYSIATRRWYPSQGLWAVFGLGMFLASIGEIPLRMTDIPGIPTSLITLLHAAVTRPSSLRFVGQTISSVSAVMIVLRASGNRKVRSINQTDIVRSMRGTDGEA